MERCPASREEWSADWPPRAMREEEGWTRSEDAAPESVSEGDWVQLTRKLRLESTFPFATKSFFRDKEAKLKMTK